MLLVITENELKTGFEILENTINEWLRAGSARGDRGKMELEPLPLQPRA